MKKRTLLIALFLAATTLVSAQKFGYINSTTLLTNMPEMKQAEKNIAAFQSKLENRGKQMVESLQKDYVEIQKKVERGELSDEQQRKESEYLKKKQDEIAAFESSMVVQFEEKRTAELQPVYDKLNEAIKNVADEFGYKMIFEQNVLLYAEEGMDVSQLVQQKLGF